MGIEREGRIDIGGGGGGVICVHLSKIFIDEDIMTKKSYAISLFSIVINFFP